MGLVMVRYGEIALKGKNRTYFLKKLRKNIRRCLKENGLPGRVWQEQQRIYIETEESDQAIQAVSRVFGVVSLSPVFEVATDIESVVQSAVQLARRLALGPARSFHIRARRADKRFPLQSPEIERLVGAAVVDATAARVDLSKAADFEIGVEVHAEHALVFGATIPGPGGLPLGSQGRVAALLSSGIDSPVAAWLMMKRGCGVIPVHFSVSQAQTDQVLAIVDALNRYGYGWPLRPVILSHEQVLGPTLAKLRASRNERWTCLFCKRAMLQTAAQIAEEFAASALVTGDSLGQVASQTLSNLEVVSYGIQKPILRPLIGLDKTEITAMAQAIGTYQSSIATYTACPFLPDRPLTQASLAKLHDLMEELSASSPPSLDPV